MTSIALAAAASVAAATASVAQVQVGDPAPGFEAKWKNFDEGRSLADLRGRVVLVEFWRTW